MYAVSDRATVLYENDQIDVNIKLISKLRPNLKNLYFVNDYSVTSELIHKEMNRMMAEFPNINLIEIRDLSLEHTSQFLEGISGRCGIAQSLQHRVEARGLPHLPRDCGYFVKSECCSGVCFVAILYFG